MMTPEEYYDRHHYKKGEWVEPGDKCPYCGSGVDGCWPPRKQVIRCTNKKCKAMFWEKWYTWKEWEKMINAIDFKE